MMSIEDREFREYASPPCYQHEFEDTAEPALSVDEIAERLNTLLEGERAGARGLIDMNRTTDGGELGALLDEVARDEARFCAMLGHHLSRLGYEPSRETGVFYDKLLQRETLADRLSLLDRGQSAVVRMLDELLPSVRDAALRDDLMEMRETHVVNIRRCAEHLED
jgi:nitronate monooxygenase